MTMITNVLTKEGKYYPVVKLQKKTVLVREYKKSWGRYYDTQVSIPISSIREVFINRGDGYWKPICTTSK